LARLPKNMRTALLLLSISLCASAQINPGSVQLKAGQTKQFTSVQPCSNWFIWKTYQGFAGVGTILSTGTYTAVYTAPSVISVNQPIIVDCGANDVQLNLLASSTIAGVAISPKSVTLGPGQSKLFTAVVSTSPPGSALTFSIPGRGASPPPAQAIRLENPTGKMQNLMARPVMSPILNQGSVPPWLGVRPSSQGIEVFIVHTNLAAGTYEGEVVVSGEQSRRYPVLLRIAQ
jgi:hypothetical protein